MLYAVFFKPWSSSNGSGHPTRKTGSPMEAKDVNYKAQLINFPLSILNSEEKF